jgi:hypothetical protein
LDEFDVVQKVREIEGSKGSLQGNSGAVWDLLDEGFQEDVELRKELRQNASDLISRMRSCWSFDCGRYTGENAMGVWFKWAETFPPFRLIDELEAAGREFRECFVGCRQKPLKFSSLLKLIVELRYDTELRLKEVLHSCFSEGCATSLDKAFSVTLNLNKFSIGRASLMIGMVLLMIRLFVLIFLCSRPHNSHFIHCCVFDLRRQLRGGVCIWAGEEADQGAAEHFCYIFLDYGFASDASGSLECNGQFLLCATGKLRRGN